MNILYVGVGLVSLGLLISTIVLVTSSSGPTGVARSLMLIEQSSTERTVVKSELPARDRLVEPIFRGTKAIASVLSPSGTTQRLATMLDRAGNPSGWSVERLLSVKGATLLLGVLLGFLIGGLTLSGFVYAAGLGAFGFFLPDLLIWNLALRRQEETAKGLAEAMDMLTVCVEAGQGFDAAILQVARNVTGPIAGEFARVLSEIQIGKSRGEAFAAMGDRINIPEVKSFTTALVQADRLGLPIAQVMREQTGAMREARKQKAEEKAQKVTVKILFPVLICIFPALFVVILGPGVIRIIGALGIIGG